MYFVCIYNFYVRMCSYFVCVGMLKTYAVELFVIKIIEYVYRKSNPTNVIDYKAKRK